MVSALKGPTGNGDEKGVQADSSNLICALLLLISELEQEASNNPEQGSLGVCINWGCQLMGLCQGKRKRVPMEARGKCWGEAWSHLEAVKFRVPAALHPEEEG